MSSQVEQCPGSFYSRHNTDHHCTELHHSLGERGALCCPELTQSFLFHYWHSWFTFWQVMPHPITCLSKPVRRMAYLCLLPWLMSPLAPTKLFFQTLSEVHEF